MLTRKWEILGAVNPRLEITKGKISTKASAGNEGFNKE